jgi:hypothetical protein
MNIPKAAPDADPWRSPVVVAQIPEGGLHREIEASSLEREAVAGVAGLREIISAHASFDLVPRSGGRVQVVGRVHARIGQTCVVTLDPIENDIDEDVDLIFAPPEEARRLADLVAEAEDSEAEVPEPPEAITNGIIDLGRIATDYLCLGVDPYPRKPGVVFEPRITSVDPEDHPFAGLKALQVDKESGDKGPKGKK